MTSPCPSFSRYDLPLPLLLKEGLGEVTAG